MKNILVIGGSYFAGRVCVEELAKRSDLAIHVFNRGRQPLRMAGITELRGDREQAEQIRSVIPPLDWEAVIDFCAYTPAHIDTLLANLPGTVKHYIFISTTSVLQKSSILPAIEAGATLSGPQSELGAYADYGYDKLRAENALRAAAERSGLAYTILRPAIIYGYYNYAPRESYFFDLLCRHQPIVIPENDLALFSFIWVVDMARLISHCIADERTYTQTYNLAAGELVSYSRIVAALGEITGKNLVPVRLSAAEIDRQGIPLPFPLNEHLLYSGTKIQHLFDFVYTPFKNGLREALKYYLMVKQQRSPAS